MPGTSFILYAGFQKTVLGIIEHVPGTAPFLFQRTISVYTNPTPNTVISDVRPVVENGAIKYLIISYINFSTPFTAAANAQFRVWGPPANNPAPTTLACGANSIAGCKTCGMGSTTDVNKCEVCADGQGELNLFVLIIQGLQEQTNRKWGLTAEHA